jgi:hypothetical protein
MGTELLTDPAMPGLYDLLPRVNARETAARFPTWMGFCPFHGDRNDPNLCIQYRPSKNREVGDLEGWVVYVGCGVCQGRAVVPPAPGETEWRKVNAVTVAEALGLPAGIALRNMDALAEHVRSGRAPATPPTQEAVDLWHASLMLYVDLPDALHARGLSEATVREYVLGWCSWRKRYSIPVWNEAGDVIGCRYWSPTNRDGKKYLGHAGCPVSLYPFPPDPQRRRKLIVCEGEFDCLLLRQHGFDAFTTTGGKGAWDEDWLPYFVGRQVIFLYDVGAESEATAHAATLRGIAARASVASLPMPNEGADVTDWFQSGGTAEGLRSVLLAATAVAGGEGGRG